MSCSELGLCPSAHWQFSPTSCASPALRAISIAEGELARAKAMKNSVEMMIYVLGGGVSGAVCLAAALSILLLFW